MASIYSRAYITLEASASHDASGGCHKIDDLAKISYTPVAMLKYLNGECGVYARRLVDHSCFPLLRRGWVLQERTLSPRVLHFAREELAWQCNALAVCECGSGDLYSEPVRFSTIDITPARSQSATLRSWNDVVQACTALRLTFARDVFPALSGIARVFATSLQDEYVAGLCRRTLIPDLLWYFEGAIKIASPWRAPSWSWASIQSDYPAGYDSFDLNHKLLPASRNLAEVADVVCEPLGADKTGELAMAHLTLRTKAVASRLEQDESRMYALRIGPTIVTGMQFLGISRQYLETVLVGLLNCRPAVKDCIDITITQIATCIDTQIVEL
ncbi:hypothetical protein EK21DRAFT_111693 [Setomelanomma holmii]|uniref:Heterokaryon incompatibility domain-containing protein n=1 Tax=Setomelanomma holmii TaxID=210430 RepID=A0A9P4LKP4_9PLEO|nr:hypothetical protein EK21DRAFT_111693 [Setomelanomma holmii]